MKTGGAFPVSALFLTFGLLLSLAAAPCGSAQTVAAPALAASEQKLLLTAAKSRIYNLRTAGVQSFGCNVDVDWQATFQAIANQQLPPDDPRLKYLHAARLSFNQPLGGSAEVVWHLPPASADDATNKPLDLLTGGVKQMVGGFLQSWTPTLDGTLIPATPGAVTKTGDGYLIEGESAGMKAAINLNQDDKVTHIRATGPGIDGSFDTVFTPGPGGLVMTRLEGDSKTSPDGPAVHIIISTTFAPVAGVQLPATLEVTVPNVAVFKMKFVDCTVERAAK